MRSPSLFWRTLLLVLLLIVASLAAWLQSYRVLERGPRAQTIAQQVVSVVNITRAALVYADPFVRSDLLAELAANEGVRIYPLEPDDKVAPLPDGPLIKLMEQAIVNKLGADTRLASEVNGIAGLWISLSIADDDYWVYISRDPVARTYGTQWIGWAAVALLLSVIGAILITRLINRPLAQLSRASAELGSGRDPAPLPETGPVEIRTVNESFNRMVTDLGKLEADRALLLAGISHDLRTPLSRLRLELEMAPLPEGSRAAMVGDIEQMDAIVRQFLDYARKAPQAPAAEVDLSAAVTAAVQRARIDAEPDCVGGSECCSRSSRPRLRNRNRSCARQSVDQRAALRSRFRNRPVAGDRFARPPMRAMPPWRSSIKVRACVPSRSIGCCGRSSAAKPRARAAPAPGWGCRSSTASPACTPGRCACCPTVRADCARK